MRILHVIESLGVGGAERSLVTLLPELKRRGSEVAVAVVKGPFNLQSALEDAEIPVHRLQPHYKWNLLAGSRNVHAKAREIGAQIIHAHLYFPAIYTGMANILSHRQVPTCLTFHNLAYRPGANKPGLSLHVRRELAKVIYRKGIDAIIGVSAPVAEHYRRVLAVEHVWVLHNAVDLTAIDAALARAAPWAGSNLRSTLNIVVPGRLVHEKGHLDFLDALSHCRERGFRFNSILAGGGPFRDRIEVDIVARGLQEEINITGQLDYDKMLDTILMADIVVIPSRFEGLGLTALEAMALGRPVVATSAGGLADVVVDSKTGYLVPPAAPNALACAIMRMAEDAKLRRWFGFAGRIRVEERFSVDVIAENLELIYRRLLNSSKKKDTKWSGIRF